MLYYTHNNLQVQFTDFRNAKYFQTLIPDFVFLFQMCQMLQSENGGWLADGPVSYTLRHWTQPLASTRLFRLIQPKSLNRRFRCLCAYPCTQYFVLLSLARAKPVRFATLLCSWLCPLEPSPRRFGGQMHRMAGCSPFYTLVYYPEFNWLCSDWQTCPQNAPVLMTQH